MLALSLGHRFAGGAPKPMNRHEEDAGLQQQVFRKPMVIIVAGVSEEVHNANKQL
jgi:hypothetical protein